MKKPQAGWRQTRKGTKKWEAKGINPATGARKSYWGFTKEEAEAEALASYGPVIIPEATETLYGFYAAIYLATVAHRSTNWKNQIGWAMDRYILPEFGRRRLSEISRADLQKFFNRLQADLKPSSVARIKIVLSGVLNLAEADELIAKNPASRVRLTRSEKPSKTALGLKDLWLLIEHARPILRPFVVLCGLAGMRRGEALGVTRAAIDREGCLSVTQQVQFEKGGPVVKAALKTASSRRRIPLPQEILDMLECGQVSSIWVCSNSEGGYMLPANIARELTAACSDAGIARISPHELRHTFVSLMENELEAPRSIIQEIIGHTDPSATGMYSHTRMEQKRKWLRRLAKQASTSGRQKPCLPEAKISGSS